MTRFPLAVVVGLVAATISQPPASDSTEQRLGKVHFATSCKPGAQEAFDRAMLYQHSFWYSASRRTFEEVLEADPQCAIAYWGIALSYLYNPHGPPPPENLPLGLEAVKKGQALGAQTPREREYIDAIAAMYVDYDKVDHRTRVQRFLAAEEQVATLYADDDEAQIAYAITLNVAASPTDKTYANQLKGAALLEPIFNTDILCVLGALIDVIQDADPDDLGGQRSALKFLRQALKAPVRVERALFGSPLAAEKNLRRAQRKLDRINTRVVKGLNRGKIDPAVGETIQNLTAQASDAIGELLTGP